MLRAILTSLTLCAGLGLNGCGQSGPLYLPGNPSQVTTPVPEQATPAEDEEREGGNDETGSDETGGESR